MGQKQKPNTSIIRVPEEKKKIGTERIFEPIMAENF